MKTPRLHLLLPALVPLLFFTVASLPVDLLGCRNRGLLAALIALGGGLLALVAATRAVVGRLRREADTHWWIASALILSIPLVYIVLLEA